MNINIIYLKNETKNENICNFNNFNKFLNNSIINILVDSNTNSKKLKKYINKWIFYRKKLLKFNEINIQIYNYDESKIVIKEFANLLKNILESKNKYELYENAYFMACNFLDYHFYSKNVCDFCDNKCGGKKDATSLIGCCHYYKNKFFGPLLPRK